MTNLLKELEKMGLNSLSFTEQETSLLEQFIDHSSAFFDNVCQHKPDKPPHDMALGLLTKAHQEAFDNYQATQPKISELQTMFTDNVGAEHASKFSTLNQAELSVISSLWFMAQGFTGIDFSYANDKAAETAELLTENQTSTEDTKKKSIKNSEDYRSLFMKAYYTGIDAAHQNQPHLSFLLTIKNYLKHLFK
ncbi:hypothetical protein [uncultured Photobacterium sp.]|uniref:hypothetical protein n=1 Tax=uncultured Photobacterium sp. TaxID=173973 RepID=UPI0026154A23|nr:hypothetical protein [uncultured Photobacterium sp.]